MEKSKTIEELFLHIVIYSYLLIPLLFLFTFKSWRKRSPGLETKSSIVLVVYGVLFFVLLLFYFEYKKYIPRDYRKLYQLFYTYLEYVFFSFILWHSIESKRIKRLIIIASVLFLIFQIQYYFRIAHARLDSVPIGIETILLFIYVLTFLYEFYKKDNTDFITNHYCFWISIGVLIYLGGSFFFYISINQLQEKELEILGNLTYITEIMKNLFFSIAVLKLSRFNNEKIKNQQPLNIPFLDM